MRAPWNREHVAHETAAPVEVFWRPGCPFCTALRVGLAARRVPATWRNIWEDPDAAAFVRASNAGNETVPTVRVGRQVLTNPSAGTVRRLVREQSAA